MNNQSTFSTSSPLLLTLSFFFICLGITAAFGFIGQCALELPYHLYGREISATVGSSWIAEDNTNSIPISSTEVTVYYFPNGLSEHIVSSQVKGVEWMANKNLVEGSQVDVVYIPGKTDKVLPSEVLQKAWQEIWQGLLGGFCIALPGMILLIYLQKTGRLVWGDALQKTFRE